MYYVRISLLIWALIVSGAANLLEAADEKNRPLEPSAEGTYMLSTSSAQLAGNSVRRNDRTSALEQWLSKQDFANWKVSNAKMGNYDVVVTWNVADPGAPQAYSIEINHRPTIRAYTVGTGGEFKRVVVGRIMLPRGVNNVTFFPSTDNVRGGLCKLKQIELVPVANLATVAPPQPVELHVPPGFEVEQVASQPLTSHPMLACFDDLGRLYLCESTGVNADAAVLAQSPPHEIRMLEDVDGDGKFDKSTLFADKLTIPQGICWHNGSIYTASPPNVWRLTDTNGDGVADDRKVLVTGFPFTGMSDDMHGGSLGRDGRLYFAAGRMQKKIRRPGGPVIYKGPDPVIVRCRPDGSELEVFCGAMGNAVGVDFTDTGDCFASGTFGLNVAGKRDVLNHCVEGGAYPVLGRTLVDHKMTGGEMPNLAQFAVSASSDLTMYRDEVFGSEYGGNLFSAMFNMHKIARHILEPDGATYRCHTEDFLTSSNADFHPTDVLEDADGSLIVVDTGAWFLIGCPTSVIAKPQLSGGIYRIRRSGVKPITDPRGLAIDWDMRKPKELVALLGDSRFAVRDRAMVELAAKQELAVPVLKAAFCEELPPRVRLNIVWTLSRIESPEAAAAARLSLRDPDDGVRQAAAMAAGLLRDREAVWQLSQMVRSDHSPSVRRETATSLGRIGNPEAVPALLASLAGVTDRFLDHAMIYALIRLDDREQTVAGLSECSPEIRRGALIALDQMDHGKLTQDDVTRALETEDARVQRSALEVISRHPGWAKQIITLSQKWLADPELSPDRRLALRGVLLALIKDQSVQQLIAKTLAGENSPYWTKLLLLDVICQSELATLPAAWQSPLWASVRSEDAEIARAAVTAITTVNQRLPPQSAFGQDELLALARNDNRPTDLRVAAAAATLHQGETIEQKEFDLLAQQCSSEIEPITRLAAANAIGSAKLDDFQRNRIIELIATAGPLELPALVRQFEVNDLDASGIRLIQSLAKSPGLSALAGDRVVKLLENLPKNARSGTNALLQRTQVDLEGQRTRLEELKYALAGGDAERGRKLFFGNKATCSACHRIGEEGGSIGPNLAGIGDIRTRRDLLEAVVFPSASFARDYEPFTVQTTGGLSHSGIIARTNPDAIFLATAERTTVRILRTEIDDNGIMPGKLSIMPQGLDHILQPEELRDLLAFLSSQREFKDSQVIPVSK